MTLTTLSVNELGDIVTLTLTTADANFIKSTLGLGDNVNNTYLILDNGTVSDAFDNVAVAIPLSAAIKASAVIPDEVPPSLLEYTIDQL